MSTTMQVEESSVHRYYDPASGEFVSDDPAVSLTDQPYSYASDDPLNENDLTGLASGGICGFVPGCGVVTDVQNTVSGATRKVVSELAPSGLDPAYSGLCFGGGFIIGAQACLDVTRQGAIYVTPSYGLTTPGITVSAHVGYIHGQTNPCPQLTDDYLHGRTLQGSGAFGAYGSGVWGNEGFFGNSDYGDEFGGGWPPGASLMQGYGFRLPFNAPGS
jgi:hypothetical protein